MLRAMVQTPMLTSYIAPEELHELERRAEAGDAAAQYGLLLYIDDKDRANDLLKKAAKAGYPPAVVTYADKLMEQSKEGGIQARKLLESVAGAGYYHAIIALGHCLEDGECGVASKKDALTWAIVSRLLTEQNRINRNLLDEIEQHLRHELKTEEINSAEQNARLLVAKMKNVIDMP